MTDEDLFNILDTCAARDDGRGIAPIPVLVTGGDYAYRGWIVGAAVKRSGLIRAMVEDKHGRLFVHNAGQIAVVT